MSPTLCHPLAAMLLVMVLRQASGHGRLWEPPSRSSMWRRGYPTPPNYDDNGLHCGGFNTQYAMNGGKCGVCGDPWNQPQPRDNEAGGKYGNGIITRTYTPGQAIDVEVDVTANHKGWFEFRLCPHNDPTTPITQQCLDQHLLELADGSGTRFQLDGSEKLVSLKLKLPPGLTCSQCVLQWKWHAGNSYGVDDTGRGCVGCGDQEEFYGCSDVAIGHVAPSSSTPAHVFPTSTVPRTQPPPSLTPSAPGKCRAIGAWQGVAELDKYCQATCPGPSCPLQYCSCLNTNSASPSTTTTTSPSTTTTTSPSTTTTTTTIRSATKPNHSSCRGINAWSGYPELDRYCNSVCPGSNCPPEYCYCQPPTQPSLHSGATHSPTNPPTNPPSTTTTKSSTPQTHINKACHGINGWRGNPDLDLYCAEQCPKGNCPAQSCSCSTSTMAPTLPTIAPRTTTSTRLTPTVHPTATPTLLGCYGINSWQGNPDLDKWCDVNCAIGVCPAQNCKCTGNAASSMAGLTTPSTDKPTTSSPRPSRTCHAIGSWAGQPELDQWCTETCAKFSCDPLYCRCSTCHAINGWAGVPELDRYCEMKCHEGYCPSEYCSCDLGHPASLQSASPRPTTSTTRPTATTTQAAATTTAKRNCHAINNWQGVPDLDRWCEENCAAGNCLPVYCGCDP